MTLKHVFGSFGVWTTSRWSRLPALIATVCLTAAVVLALSQSRRRFGPAADRTGVGPGSFATRLERDRELRNAELRLHGEMLEKLEQILSRLPQDP